MDVERRGDGLVYIRLTGDELALAVDAYIRSCGVRFGGPRTVCIHEQEPRPATSSCPRATVYVDPLGWVDDSAVGRLAALAEESADG